MSLKEESESESKRKRPESPEFTVKGNTDLSEERSAHDEHKNKRLKSERPLSPAPSCMSLRSECSMDPLTNFRGEETYPLDYRVKTERPASPTISYMSLRTDWSMDPPSNLRDVPLDTRGRPERAPSPAPSYMSQIYSDWLEGPLTSCKAEDSISFNPRLMTEDHLKCLLCKSMLKDPVSIMCGHNYCRDCINVFWDNCAGGFVCPQCGRTSETRPVLNTNVALAEVVKDLKKTFSPALPPQSYARPEDVACDFCTENRLKAVKSCSTCGVFLCETHIRQHYTIPALQKHTLRDVTAEDQMRMKLSQEQQKTDSVTSGQQNPTDETQDLIKEEVLESVLNSSMSEKNCLNEVAKTSRSEADINKDDTDVRNLAQLCSKLQEEVSGLKQSFSKLKGKKTKKDKYYDDDDDDDDDDDEEDDDDNEEEEEDYDDNDDEEDDDDNEEEEEDCDDNDDEEDYNNSGSNHYEDDGYDEDHVGEGYSDDCDDEEENNEDDYDEDDYDDDYNDDDDNEEEDDYY